MTQYRVLGGPMFYRTRRGDTFHADMTPAQERRHMEAGRIVRVLPKNRRVRPAKPPKGASRSTQPPAGGQ